MQNIFTTITCIVTFFATSGHNRVTDTFNIDE